MAEFIQYNQISDDFSDGSSIFLRIKSNESFLHCRIVGDPVKTCRVYHNKIWVNMKLEDATRLYEEYPDWFRFAPRPTFAVLVIDRTDGKVKILEFPTMVFRDISKRFAITGVNPGSKSEGQEWKIKSTGQGKNTTYTSVFIDTVPLTEDEIQRVRKFKEKKDLVDYYPDSTYAEVLRKYGLSPVSTV